jgi:hypothetical protein
MAASEAVRLRSMRAHFNGQSWPKPCSVSSIVALRRQRSHVRIVSGAPQNSSVSVLRKRSAGLPPLGAIPVDQFASRPLLHFTCPPRCPLHSPQFSGIRHCTSPRACVALTIECGAGIKSSWRPLLSRCPTSRDFVPCAGFLTPGTLERGGSRRLRPASKNQHDSGHSATASAALTGKRGGASRGAGTSAASHLKRLAFTFPIHTGLTLTPARRRFRGAARGSRAQQAGSIFHGIRAVHATGRSAHRHQHG